MNVREPLAREALRRMAICLLATTFLLATLLPSIGSPIVQRAHAGGTMAYLEKAGNLEYDGGSWNTHIFMADDGSGSTLAYCVEPSKHSPSEGMYDKCELNAPSGRNAELRADLWFAWGGPGFDESMWPHTNWNGERMTGEDYYLCSHILLADTYSSSGFEATYGSDDNFRDWLVWNVIGFDLVTGEKINNGAFGRVANARKGEVPNDYEAFLLAGGDSQMIAACAYYNPCGTIKMMKRSSNPSITNNNSCYSFEGITYGIYGDESCSTASDTGYRLVLDKNGFAQCEGIPVDTYYIREIESSLGNSGYAYDPTVYPCDVRSGEESWVHDVNNPAGDVDENDINDEPITYDVHILVQKRDMLTKSSVPSGTKNLANALFKVSYYDNPDGNVTGKPKRSWTVRSDEDGKIDLGDEELRSFVSGSELFTDSDGVVLPLGTYKVEEVTPPAMYEIPEGEEPVVFTLKVSGTNEHDVSSDDVLVDTGIVFDEAPVRQDLRFSKRDLDTQRPMAGIPFLVTRRAKDGSVIERHVIVTNANGVFDSSSQLIDHTTRTNANDEAVRVRGDSYVVNESKLDMGAGVWFGVASDGSWVKPDNGFGAFPDGVNETYVFEELPVKANEGKALVSFEAVVHAAHSTSIDLGTVGNTTPTIATSAYDEVDGDKLVSRDLNASVHDTVSYSGLIAGRSYRIEGRLVNAQSGEPLRDARGDVVTSSTSFTASATSGSIELSFSFDANGLPDQTRLVACETLFEGDRELAKHDDLDDSSQTVTVIQPSMATSASDAKDGDSQLVGDVEASVCDRVGYSGLVPGAEYELEGILMDRASGAPFLSQGHEVKASMSFVAPASTGSIDMAFSFDAAELDPGTQLVVFERLSHDGILVCSHEDIEDAGQTVSVFPPNLKTKACDPYDGDNVVSADTETVIVDTVTFTGLTPGAEYLLEGVLVDKSTGQPMLDPFDRPITASHLFTPVEPNGNTEVTFMFDAANVEVSATGVVFEELYRNGSHLASHIDLEDAGQTVTIDQPLLQTFASVDGDSKQVMRDDGVSITDAVIYHNLKVGKRYRIEGTLVDKETGTPVMRRDGSTVTSSLEFTAQTPDGTAKLDFEFDATPFEENTRLVVFEKLYHEGVQLTSHENLKDAMQEVTVSRPSISTSAKSRNDTKEIVRDANVTITDVVSYESLMPGKVYELDGTVMVKETASPLEDGSGNPVMAHTQFTAESVRGSVELNFTLDTSALDLGTELVVFERLTSNGAEIATHEDIDDLGQTVTVKPATIITKASDPEDGDQWINAREDMQVLDTIIYEGLAPGAEYEFRGSLMNKRTKSAVLDSEGNAIGAKKTVTAEEGNGTVEMLFTCDASAYADPEEIVVFESLYRNDELIASHEDYENASQTVIVSPPCIKTSARDAADGDKEITKKGVVSIIDSVEYSGLEAGRTYRLSGALMINDGTLEGTPACDAFGVPITAQATFTPDASHGTTELSFEIDASILKEGTQIVAFERLVHGDTVQATHEDIRDESQTVTIAPPTTHTFGKTVTQTKTPSPTPTPSTPSTVKAKAVDTGDKPMVALAICAALSMLALIGLIWIRYRVVPKEK